MPAAQMRKPLSSIEFANFPPDRASTFYRMLLRDIDAYLTEMEVPRRFIEAMTDTSSTDIYWLDFKQAHSMKDVPSIVEWVAASCGPPPGKDSDLGLDALSPRPGCELTKIDNARDATDPIGNR
jgi:hypothetical protein